MHAGACQTKNSGENLSPWKINAAKKGQVKSFDQNFDWVIYKVLFTKIPTIKFYIFKKSQTFNNYSH